MTIKLQVGVCRVQWGMMSEQYTEIKPITPCMSLNIFQAWYPPETLSWVHCWLQQSSLRVITWRLPKMARDSHHQQTASRSQLRVPGSLLHQRWDFCKSNIGGHQQWWSRAKLAWIGSDVLTMTLAQLSSNHNDLHWHWVRSISQHLLSRWPYVPSHIMSWAISHSPLMLWPQVEYAAKVGMLHICLDAISDAQSGLQLTFMSRTCCEETHSLSAPHPRGQWCIQTVNRHMHGVPPNITSEYIILSLNYWVTPWF